MEEFDSGHDETFGLDESQLALLGTTDGNDDGVERDYEDLSGVSNQIDEPEQEEGVSEPVVEEKKVEEIKTQEKVEDHKVPVSVLQKEREERKQWRDRANQLEGQLQMLMQSLNGQNVSANNDSKQINQESVDPNLDPISYINNTIQSLQKKVETFEESHRQQMIERQQLEIENHITNEWSNSLALAKQEIPDIEDATRYIVEQRANQLSLAGYDQSQIQNTLKSEFMGLVRIGKEQLGDPAKFAYKFAQTWGYQPKPNIPSLKEQSQRAEEAKRRTRTITSVPGTPASDDITLESLDQMSESQFMNWVSKNPKKYEKIIMGSMSR